MMLVRVIGCLVMAVLALSSVWAAPPVRWDTLQQGADGGFGTPTFVRLRTKGDFENHWRRLGLGSAPKDVNFNTEEVIAIHLGDKSNGAKVFVETMEQQGGLLLVHYVEQLPSNRDRSAKTTRPFVIVRLNRVAGSERYVGRTATQTRNFLPAYCTCSRCRPTCRHTCGCGLTTWPVPIEWRVLDSGQYSDWPNDSWYVLSDESAFDQYWFQILRKDRSSKMPRIDWENDMVVALHLDKKFTTGYGILVTDVQMETLGEWTIKYSETQPTMGFRGQSITRPYALIRVPRTSARLTVRKNVGIPMR